VIFKRSGFILNFRKQHILVVCSLNSAIALLVDFRSTAKLGWIITSLPGHLALIVVITTDRGIRWSWGLGFLF
jgi:hypothetical protein